MGVGTCDLLGFDLDVAERTRSAAPSVGELEHLSDVGRSLGDPTRGGSRTSLAPRPREGRGTRTSSARTSLP